MNWPHLETQWIREEYNRRKNRGIVPRGRPRDKYLGKIKKEVHCKKYQEVPDGMEDCSQPILGLNDQ
jgi:hypothetical protein